MYWIIFIGFALLSWLVSANLKRKFEKYSQVPLPNGMTGRDVAEQMLHDNGIYDVQITCTPGQLTDHYNPMNKTVNLSEGFIIVIVLPLQPSLHTNAVMPCNTQLLMLR